MYTVYISLKFLQASCFTTFDSSTCQGNLSLHERLPKPSRTNVKLRITGVNTEENKNPVRNKFKIKPLALNK